MTVVCPCRDRIHEVFNNSPHVQAHFTEHFVVFSFFLIDAKEVIIAASERKNAIRIG